MNNHNIFSSKIIHKYPEYPSIYSLFDSFLSYLSWKEAFLRDMQSSSPKSITTISEHQPFLKKISKWTNVQHSYTIKTIYHSPHFKQYLKNNHRLQEADPLHLFFQYAFHIEYIHSRLTCYYLWTGYELGLYLENKLFQAQEILFYLRRFSHLFQALNCLYRHQLVHYDLKFENIVYCPTQHIFKIIDNEELLGTIDEYINFDKQNYMHALLSKRSVRSFYPVWPLDRYFWKQSSSSNGQPPFLGISVSDIQPFRIRSLQFNEKRLRRLVQHYHENRCLTKYKTNNSFHQANMEYLARYKALETLSDYRTYFEKIDVYSLGLVFSEFFCQCEYYPSSFHYAVYHLRDKMIEPDYRRRFSIHDTIDYYEQSILLYL